jgi:hypothetical protein
MAEPRDPATCFDGSGQNVIFPLPLCSAENHRLPAAKLA